MCQMAKSLIGLSLMLLAVVEGEDNSSSIRLTIECPMQKGLMANPKVPCDHLFYICYDFVGYMQNCPVNLFFDPELNECDVWYNVPVCSGVTRTIDLVNTTDQPRDEPSTFDPKIFDCSKKRNGNYPDVDAKTPNCSNRYFTCDMAKVIVNNCPNDYFYDPNHNWCDTFENVFACSGKTRRPHIPLPKPALEFDFDCTDKIDDIYPDPHENCSHHYFICVSDTAYIIDCPEDLVYNLEMNKCERREDNFECIGVDKTTQRDVTNATTFPSFQYTFSCINMSDGLHSDPDELCSIHYFTCIAGHTYPMHCPAKLYFDVGLKDCVYKKDVPACAKSTSSLPLSTVMSTMESTANNKPQESLPLTSTESLTETMNSTNMSTIFITSSKNSFDSTSIGVSVDNLSTGKPTEHEMDQLLTTTAESHANEPTTLSNDADTLEPLNVMTLH